MPVNAKRRMERAVEIPPQLSHSGADVAASAKHRVTTCRPQDQPTEACNGTGGGGAEILSCFEGSQAVVASPSCTGTFGTG
jgi:hypothetical protein